MTDESSQSVCTEARSQASAGQKVQYRVRNLLPPLCRRFGRAVGEMPDPELAMACASPAGQVRKRPMAVFAARTHEVKL